ncbi:hypothetical protein [Kribbella sp. CA-293567]|uniref:hypothetical protein n=1 Tax=Kribbella sp. CA-293567 TaxID=3002436 RepID=UPI0022DE512E|nr:hypothetical protein [Kribbella sp. CA-293567]WBQ02998.1 hypothetical protein OX958_23810 [Kribbella sp. CA-293567]
MPWFRDKYAEAVWGSDSLRPNEKLVALTYAEYAGDETKPDKDDAWVTWAELSLRTGLRSKDAINRALRGLEAAGWLIQLTKARQHKSPRYRLVIQNTNLRATYDRADEPEDPAVREAYPSDPVEVRLADGSESPEVREADACPVDNPTPEVRLTDNWTAPEVRDTDSGVRETTPRGTRGVPNNSKETLTIKAVLGSGTEPQDARAPDCRHTSWTVDGYCVRCDRHEPCGDCRRLLKVTPDGRCWQHQDQAAAS